MSLSPFTHLAERPSAEEPISVPLTVPLTVQVTTPLATAQLAVWDKMSPFRRRLALQVFSSPDLLDAILPKNINLFSDSKWYAVLNCLMLISACKSTRRWVPLLIERIKRWIIPFFVDMDTVCWDRMAGFPVGEYVMLFRNYHQQGPVRYLQFTPPGSPQVPDPALTHVVSRTPPYDLTCPIMPGVFICGQATSWRLPLSNTAVSFARVLLRFQETGDLYEIHKYGFCSSRVNRLALANMIEILEGDNHRLTWVTSSHRLKLLQELLEISHAVIDLSPPIRLTIHIDPGDEFDLMTAMSGLNIGFNPRDIRRMNAHCLAIGRRRISFNGETFV